MATLLDDLYTAVEGFVQRAFDTVSARIANLEPRVKALSQRVAELEARPTLRYMGVWDERTSYEEGSFATRSGSLWYCTAASARVRKTCLLDSARSGNWL
jgi:hypothetical protein